MHEKSGNFYPIIFRRILKEVTESANLIFSGRSFQNLGALTANALPPLVFSQYHGTDRRPLPKDLKVRTDVYGTKRLKSNQYNLKIYSKTNWQPV